MATSENQVVENPPWYHAEQQKLRVIQRRVSRHKKGGSNRRKAVLELQHQHLQIANSRKDYLDKLVHHFITNYDVIALEICTSWGWFAITTSRKASWTRVGVT